MENEAYSPVRFRMKPAEQLEAFSRMEAAGMELVGIFHSHPSGPDGPSPTDVAEAAYAAVHLIWSRRSGDWQARAFWIEQGRISEVKLDVAGGG